jgi:xanthine/uracil permease
MGIALFLSQFVGTIAVLAGICTGTSLASWSIFRSVHPINVGMSTFFILIFILILPGQPGPVIQICLGAAIGSTLLFWALHFIGWKYLLR